MDELELDVTPAADAVKPAPVKPAATSKKKAAAAVATDAVEPAPAVSDVPATVYAVVGGADVDDVILSNVVYKNIYAKKSLTVHHLQRRLAEWGFVGAHLDKDGWYGDATVAAVHEFQAARGLAVGELDLITFQAIFEGDTNVRVIP